MVVAADVDCFAFTDFYTHLVGKVGFMMHCDADVSDHAVVVGLVVLVVDDDDDDDDDVTLLSSSSTVLPAGAVAVVLVFAGPAIPAAIG